MIRSAPSPSRTIAAPRISRVAIAAGLLLALISASRAQVAPPSAPAATICAIGTMAVTTSTANQALPSTSTLCPGVSAKFATILNDGSNEVFVAFGGSSVTATTANVPVPPGYSISQYIGGSTYVATITASSTSTVRVMLTSGELKYGQNGGNFTPAVPSIAFTALSNGAVSSTVPGSGTYAVAAPSGLTSATWAGGCSGASTVSGFSASGGAWSATFTTPSAPCTGLLDVTGTGSNTASAASPVVTIGTTNVLLIATASDFLINTGSKLLIQ